MVDFNYLLGVKLTCSINQASLTKSAVLFGCWDKITVGIQKNFLSLLLALKVDQILFFHEAFLINLTQKVLPNLGLFNKYIQGCGNTLRL